MSIFLKPFFAFVFPFLSSSATTKNKFDVLERSSRTGTTTGKNPNNAMTSISRSRRRLVLDLKLHIGYLILLYLTNHEIKFRTSKYMNSFLPNCVKSWNNIGKELGNCVSINEFREVLPFILRHPKKAVFDIHESTGVQHILRLRLKCSKKRQNILDTSDWCYCHCASENSFDFLSRCNSFYNY